MVLGEASIHNIMGGMESTGGVRLHNHKRKLKQRFDIIKKLGQGTYGKVQLGINKETGQEVAIKTIKKCKIETEADLIRIRREIQIMSSVQHPNIIHIYEVFENKEKMVLVMEYAAGGELYDYLSERKVLSEPEARRIFRQISIAVFYCHKHKICHRDLKLENILLDQVGNAKIADFGLSNVFDEQRLLNTFCGSPLYASPEIVKGTPYHGPEVDCWSLGVLLYTLVYGAMPFDGSNFKRLTRQISQSDYFEPRTPSPASPLIKDMLTKCPTQRSDIEKICSHWWVNEGYEQNCLDIAEDLAAQTPVRLDLLLSLVPQSASADKLVVGDQRQPGEVVNNTMGSDNLAPTRCHSVGSLMELDRNNSDRRVREMIAEEPRSTVSSDSKRKLETTPSMDETPSLETGVKRKERPRKKDKSEDSAPRAHRFTSNRHNSAPIAHPITEEAMEIDPSINENFANKPQLDLRNDETASACLELIKESLSKSPSKERSKTPVAQEQPTIAIEKSSRDFNENVNDAKPMSNKLAGVQDECAEPLSLTVVESQPKISALEKNEASTKDEIVEEKIQVAKSKVSNKDETVAQKKSPEINDEVVVPIEIETMKETSVRDTKKLKQKALSVDCDLSNDVAQPPSKPVERRRSKIFETAEKFNQLAAGMENDKPKKIFIPGVNVGGAKRAFERKASLSSIVVPQVVKQSASKVIIDVPNEKKNEKICDKPNVSPATSAEFKSEIAKREEEKKRAVEIITQAIGKPPVQKKLNGSPPITPQSPDYKKLALKIPLGPNDLRNATVSVTTPVDTKFPFETKPVAYEKSANNTPESQSLDNSYADEPTVSSKMEITLKSATLPRPRKTSKAEITLSGIKSTEGAAYKTEVEAKIDAFHPQKLRTQRSEVAFPVAAVVTPTNRSSSLEPEGAAKIAPKERIIPIQVESDRQQQSQRQTTTPPPKPPMPQRSLSQRSNSLSRQSTVDSDTDSALGSTIGPEPIRKSPREYIIPIAVEGGGYVTPRSGSVEPETKTSTPTASNAPRSRFGRPRRMSSLLSDASEDESPFSTLQRDSDDLLQRHMHRLRSSRPTRQPPEHADSLSSGEDDDDDGFELLTAENLFSTLLSRVRSLTQRLNVDDNRSSGFPSSRLLGRLGSNSSQGFWGLHEPLSRRLADSSFRRPISREMDRFGKRDSAMPSNSGTPSSPGARSTPSRESIFEMGSSNTLPRDKKFREDNETSGPTTMDSLKMIKDTQDTLEQSFTPSLARRLSRQFIEQTRQSLPRSPSIPREKLYRSSTEERSENDDVNRQSSSTISDQTEYRSRSCDRGVRRTNSFLENNDRAEKFEYRSPRRSVSLFDDEDEPISPQFRQVMTLGRKYRDPAKSGSTTGLRRDSFHNYRTEKIQEESADEFSNSPKNTNVNNEFASTSDCFSASNSTVNLGDTASSFSARSCETSPTESSSTIGDYTAPCYKQEISRDFENRLLAAENLIKASKLRNLSPGKFDPNLTSSYKDTDKCDKELLGSMTDLRNGGLTKRRSCIPSLRLRSGSLTRESGVSGDRRKTVSCSQDAGANSHDPTPERSILSKFFRAGSSSRAENHETKEKSPKAKGPRRISRFLRPDFFDTPREESQYVKDKEAQKAAENERRKSRFTRKKNDVKPTQHDDVCVAEEKPEKELKNEANALTRDKTEIRPKDNKSGSDANSSSAQIAETKLDRQTSKTSFFQSLEKKLEKFRSSDDGTKLTNGNSTTVEEKERTVRENSAPPVELAVNEGGLIKRAISVEDLPVCEPTASTSKRRVSSVLGLFKNDSSKPSPNGQRTQNTLLSKFKRNPYRGSRSDTVLTSDQNSSTNSKIPTKFVGKVEPKPLKKMSENKKSPEKTIVETKKSPTKEKSPTEKITTKKCGSVEKQTKSVKKVSPEKLSERKMDKPEKFASSKDTERKTSSPEKIGVNKSVGSRLAMVKKLSLEKTSDNKQIEGKTSDTDERNVVKTKKNVRSIANLVKNGSVSKLEKTEKTEEGEKKVKKTVKSKENADKDGADGTKKKKIVRVVKKVVKKSDSSDSKSEDKEKPTKSLTKDATCSLKKDSSPESSSKSISKSTDKSPEDKSKSESFETSNKIKDKNVDVKISAINDNETSQNSPLGCAIVTEVSAFETSRVIKKPMKIDCSPTKTETSSLSSETTTPSETESNKIGNSVPNSDADSKNSINPTATKAIKTNLKLDLSKIPQHAFKTPTTMKKDFSKVELSNSKSDEAAENPTENPPKMTHRANITGNKIVIDKALRAAEVAALQREDDTPKMREISENIVEYSTKEAKNPQQLDDSKCDISKETHATNSSEIRQIRPTNLLLDTTAKKPSPSRTAKDQTSDQTDDMFSPIDDNESFDSWSICSADLNHRHDLHSPTSPSYSPSSRGDHGESIIDRIRRKSFYSRFNERKRKSSLNPQSPGIGLPASSSLPRKYSFNSTRDKDCRKSGIYGSSARRYPERSYSLYNDETRSYVKSPIDRDRYSEIGSLSSLSGDLKSPNDQYGSLGSCYDPLRRYRMSPTPDSIGSQRKYQSTDYGLDNDAGAIKTRLSPSYLNGGGLESYTGRTMLPRKYGSVSSCPETKTADYYEELLAPTRSDYFSSRKTPVPNDYSPRHENGHHNGNVDGTQLDSDKWRTYSDRIAVGKLTDGSDETIDKQTRSSVGKDIGIQDVPTSSSDQGATSKTE